MKRLALNLETLGCEASEEDVLDELLAHEGVLAAEVDLAHERIAVAFDEERTSRTALLDHLRFFGIVPKPDRPLAAYAA